MISVIIKIFAKGDRLLTGMICGAAGIAFNLLLFALKLAAGLVSGSVSIIADAVNNLSDAGNSLVTVFGFKLSNRQADRGHPYGHGRYEYIFALVVGLLIMFMGLQMGKSSAEQIISPSDVDYGVLSVIVLGFSVLLKFYMFFYNKKYAKITDSSGLRAAARDSLSDCGATAAVILGLIVRSVSGVNIDGLCGLLVSILIVYGGFLSVKETVDLLLGRPPEREFVEGVEAIIRACPEVKGWHGLRVHEYGKGKLFVSLHAEMDHGGDFVSLHNAVDDLEAQIAVTMGCEVVIHMDPDTN